MRYLWVLLIPALAFGQLAGDKDRDRSLRDRDSYTGDTQGRTNEPHPDIDLSLEGFKERADQRKAEALSDRIPWEQIEQWIIFDDISNNEVFRRLNKQGPPPGDEGPPLEEEFDDNPFRKPSPRLFDVDFHRGWSRFFSLQYHGPRAPHIIRFRSMPDRKGGHSPGGDITAFSETCRAWLARVRGYWRRYHEGETAPQPCTPEPLPERVERREVIPPPEPFKPPPVTTTEDIQAAPSGPVIDEGVRTTYSAEDGRPIQGQNNPGHHRASGSATLSSGQVIVDLNTSVGAGRNDMSFIDLNYVGHARSTDTSNSNTYVVYALSKSKILIRSSSGTDTSTVNFTVEGQ